MRSRGLPQKHHNRDIVREPEVKYDAPMVEASSLKKVRRSLFQVEQAPHKVNTINELLFGHDKVVNEDPDSAMMMSEDDLLSEDEKITSSLRLEPGAEGTLTPPQAQSIQVDEASVIKDISLEAAVKLSKDLPANEISDFHESVQRSWKSVDKFVLRSPHLVRVNNLLGHPLLFVELV